MLLKKATLVTETCEPADEQAREVEMLGNVVPVAAVVAVAGCAIGVAAWIVAGYAFLVNSAS